jgi:hypothetical protein
MDRLPKLTSKQTTLLSHQRTCQVCSQRFDTRDQDQVFHHSPEPHEPLITEWPEAAMSARSD